MNTNRYYNIDKHIFFGLSTFSGNFYWCCFHSSVGTVVFCHKYLIFYGIETALKCDDNKIRAIIGIELKPQIQHTHPPRETKRFRCLLKISI